MRSRLGISISGGTLDLTECAGSGRGSVAPRPHPALFYRRAFDGGEATILVTLFSRERLNTAGRCTSARRGRKRVIVPNPRDSWDRRTDRLDPIRPLLCCAREDPSRLPRLCTQAAHVQTRQAGAAFPYRSRKNRSPTDFVAYSYTSTFAAQAPGEGRKNS